MPRKITAVINNSGDAKTVMGASSMSNGKSYIRNPKNTNQILEIQSKEGRQFLCFTVTSFSPITTDSKNAVYVDQDVEAVMERI